jgi:hypothetical protein
MEAALIGDWLAPDYGLSSPTSCGIGEVRYSFRADHGYVSTRTYARCGGQTETGQYQVTSDRVLRLAGTDHPYSLTGANTLVLCAADGSRCLTYRRH